MSSPISPIQPNDSTTYIKVDLSEYRQDHRAVHARVTEGKVLVITRGGRPLMVWDRRPVEGLPDTSDIPCE